MATKQAPEAKSHHVKVIATNRRARFDYAIEEKVEAGLALLGSEVKSLREGNAVISDAYAIAKNDELFLLNCKIQPYKSAGAYGHTLPDRTRKLLLNRKEIDHLISKVTQGAYTLIPLSLYFKDGRAKVELGLARGKTHEDRREDIKERESTREMERALRPRPTKPRGGRRGEEY